MFTDCLCSNGTFIVPEVFVIKARGVTAMSVGFFLCFFFFFFFGPGIGCKQETEVPA